MSVDVRPERLTFIDVARTYAIILALLAHVFASTGFFQQLGQDSLLIKQVTRTATPLFVFMFGFMLEYVYIKRLETQGLDVMSHRLFVRSFQCYVAYVLISFSSLLGGHRTVQEFFASLLFFSNARFGNILRAYCVMLLFAPFILRLRVKFGVHFIFAALILLVSSYLFVDTFKGIDFGVFSHQANVFFGIGPYKGGPSVYGAISFMLAGMFMASSVARGSQRTNKGFSRFYFTSLVLMGSFLLLAGLFLNEGPVEAWRLFADFTYRRNNAPGYYIIGIMTSVLTITLICFLIGSRPLPKVMQFILPLGTSSLISYTAGNIILNLLGTRAGSVNLAVFVVLFFLSLIFIAKYIKEVPCFSFCYDLLNCNGSSVSQRLGR